MRRKIEFLRGERDGQVVLRSPEVGTFTCALDRGNVVVPGTLAGEIETLGETVHLTVPRGIFGRITSDKPVRVNEPVGYGDVLYVLASIDTLGADEATDAHANDVAGELVFRSPHTGRFWHRPAPRDPAFVSVGDSIESGSTLGLIEVMKTFTHLDYDPGTQLPDRARVTKILVDDGAEVSEGDALFELES